MADGSGAVVSDHTLVADVSLPFIPRASETPQAALTAWLPGGSAVITPRETSASPRRTRSTAKGHCVLLRTLPGEPDDASTSVWRLAQSRKQN